MAEKKQQDSVEDAELFAAFEAGMNQPEEVGTEDTSDDLLFAAFEDGMSRGQEEEGDTFGKDVASLIPEPVKVAGKAALGKFMESPVGEAVTWAGEKVERYAAAPARAAIGKGDIGAFAEQFGEDPTKAPSGEELALKAGVSPYWAGTAGLGIEMLADPTNLIPVGAIGKAGVKGIAMGTRAAVKGTVKTGAKAVINTSKYALRKSAAAADAIAGIKGFRNAVDIGEGVLADTTTHLKKIFDPRVAPDYDEMLRIAGKNGIDPDVLPSSVEFGKQSVISRGERKIAEGLGGEQLLNKHTKATQKINEAFDNQLKSFSGEAPLSPADAGKAMKEGYDKAAKKLFEEAEVTYASIYKDAPNLSVSEKSWASFQEKMQEVSQRIDRIGETHPKGTTLYRQAKLTKGYLEKINETGGNYGKLYEQMSSIGEAAFKKQTVLGAVPPDVKALRDMYFGISETLMETAGDLRPQLEATNNILKNFFTDRSNISKVLDKTKAPEQVFDSLIKNGNTKTIQSLKNVLAPEDFAKLKGSFMESIVSRNVDDFISFKQLNNRLNRNRDILEIMYSPQEIADIKDLIRLGDRIDIPVLSTSGTGASNAFKLNKLEEVMLDKAFVEKLKSIARSKGVPEEIIKQSNSTRGISRLMRSMEKLKEPYKKSMKRQLKVLPPLKAEYYIQRQRERFEQ